MRKLALAALLSLFAGSALAQDAAALEAQGDAAYQRKDYAASLDLYEQAIAAGKPDKGLYYDAACTAALLGKTERAWALLDLAVDAGYADLQKINTDPDLAGLRSDPRLAALADRVQALHPEQRYLLLLADYKLSVPARYLPTRRAVQAGMVVPSRNDSVFADYYANLASMVGEYDEARAIYGRPKAKNDPIAAGYTKAVPANALVLERAKGRRAVMFNESHGEAQTRAAIYTMLAPLRAAGFTHLAMETLTPPDPEPSGEQACAAPLLGDAGLPTRGYPTKATGYYTNEPVDGEIVREALRLGFTLVSYDGGGNNSPREQHEAELLACIFKREPDARLVVIAGFGHIYEKLEGSWQGGAMAYRFRQITGFDPLTVNTADLLPLDPGKLSFPAADKGRRSQAYALLNDKGEVFGSDAYDVLLYVRSPAHRNDGGGSWLELDGVRKPSAVSAKDCGGVFPCLVQARGAAEGDDAIPNDSCVIVDAAQGRCTLYLRPGKYRIALIGEPEKLLATLQRRVR